MGMPSLRAWPHRSFQEFQGAHLAHSFLIEIVVVLKMAHIAARRPSRSATSLVKAVRDGAKLFATWRPLSISATRSFWAFVTVPSGVGTLLTRVFSAVKLVIARVATAKRSVNSSRLLMYAFLMPVPDPSASPSLCS